MAWESWTQEEIDYISANYAHKSNEVLQKHMRIHFDTTRTSYSIVARAVSLGLRKSELFLKQQREFNRKQDEKYYELHKYRKKEREEKFITLPQFIVEQVRKRQK